jgi:hypothetical protein
MQLQNCAEREAQTPTVPNILKPSPSMGEGWVGVMSARSRLAARECRKSRPFVSAGTRMKHFREAKNGLLGSDVLCGALAAAPPPPPKPSPIEGEGCCERGVTAIERHCTRGRPGEPDWLRQPDLAIDDVFEPELRDR